MKQSGVCHWGIHSITLIESFFHVIFSFQSPAINYKRHHSQETLVDAQTLSQTVTNAAKKLSKYRVTPKSIYSASVTSLYMYVTRQT